jgi:hypothetical protein
MIMGILAFPTAIVIIGFLMAPVALVLGIVALVKAHKKPLNYGGKGFAIAGVVTSCITLLLLPMILAIAIPNLLAARRAANEGSAISSLRTIYGAQQTLQAGPNGRPCGSLTELGSMNLIDQQTASGQKNDYQFEVVPTRDLRGCDVHATPVRAMSTGGERSFFIDNVGVIRGANREGQKAEKVDPVLNLTTR